MSIEEIRALKHARPFRPFDLLIKGGRKIRIPLEHRIALSPGGESVAGFGQDGYFLVMLPDIERIEQTGRRRSKAS